MSKVVKRNKCGDCGKGHATGFINCEMNDKVSKTKKCADKHVTGFRNCTNKPVSFMSQKRDDSSADGVDESNAPKDKSADTSFDSTATSSSSDEDSDSSDGSNKEDVCPDGFCPICPAPNKNNNFKKRTKLNKNTKPKGMCAHCFDRTFVKPRRAQLSPKDRDKLWEHYFGKEKDAKCLGCNSEDLSVSGKGKWIAAHIVAHAKGGDVDLTNLLPMCADCNWSCHTKTIPAEIVTKYGEFRLNRLNPPKVAEDHFDCLGLRLTELNNELAELSLSNAMKIVGDEGLWNAWKAAHIAFPGRDIYVGVSKIGVIKFSAM
jgi:hypothetical protein